MFGYTNLGFGSFPSRILPLSLTIENDIGGDGNLVVIGAPPGSSGTTSAGDIDFNAVPAGATGNYTYAWALSELVDGANAFAISTQGTTNAQRYDTSRIAWNAATPPNPPNAANYRVTCTVVDTTTTEEVIVTSDFTITVA